MTDPERKSFLRELKEIFQRQDRAPLIAGLIAIPVIIVIALVAGGGDDSESIPSSEAFGESAAAPPPTTTSETTTSDAEAAPADPADEGGSGKEFAVIESVDSSWVKGQGSLLFFAGYLDVTQRAEDVASNYQSARDAIAAEQEALAERQREQAKAAARRKALAAYREALRQARLERERQERLLAERRQRIKEKLQALREKYKVPPGEECSIPEVAATFDCSTGYPF